MISCCVQVITVPSIIFGNKDIFSDSVLCFELSQICKLFSASHDLNTIDSFGCFYLLFRFYFFLRLNCFFRVFWSNFFLLNLICFFSIKLLLLFNRQSFIPAIFSYNFSIGGKFKGKNIAFLIHYFSFN